MTTTETTTHNIGTFYTGLASTPFTVGVINWTTKEKLIELDVIGKTGTETRADYKAKLATLKNDYKHLLTVNPYDAKSPVMRLKTLAVTKMGLVSEFPNFHKTGNVPGMKKQVYGKGALLVRCGDYIYNVTSNPKIYHINAE